MVLAAKYQGMLQFCPSEKTGLTCSSQDFFLAMLRLKKSACQFPAKYQFRMILVLTFLLVLLCSCWASLAKQQGPQEQVSCCNGELHEPAYSSHTSLFSLFTHHFSFHSVRKLGFFWQCCDLHAVVMPHRGETWKLNLRFLIFCVIILQK